jgi:uncharacterized protein YdgA (DUF945 family)
VNKKQSLVVAGIFVAVYVATSWGLGRAVHKYFDAWENDLAKQPTPMLKITAREYSPGIFSSTEVLTFEVDPTAWRGLNGPARALRNIPLANFTVRNRIVHGPLPGLSLPGVARIQSTLVLDEPMRTQIATTLGGREPISVDTLLGFIGGGRVHVSSPAFEAQPDGGSLSWQGIEGRFTYGRKLDAVRCDVVAPGLNGTLPDGSSVRLDKMQLTCNLTRSFEKLYTGTMEFRVATLSATQANGELSNMENTRVSSHSQAKGEYVDMTAVLNIGTVRIPQITMHDAQYDVTFNHLHGPTYSKLAGAIQGLGADSAEFVSPLDIATELLEHSPEIVINRIGFAMPEGEAGLTGTLRLKDFSQADLALGSPQRVLTKLEATAHLWLDEGLLTRNWPPDQAGAIAQIRNQIAQFEQLGYVTHKDHRFDTQLEFKQGMLTINGKPLGAGGL